MLGIKDNHYSSHFVNNRRSGNVGYYYKKKLADFIDISDEMLDEYAKEDLLDWVINPKNNEY